MVDKQNINSFTEKNNHLNLIIIMKESLVDMLLAYKEVDSKKNFDKLPKKVQKTILVWQSQDPENKGVPYKLIGTILKEAKSPQEDMQKVADALKKDLLGMFSEWGLDPLMEKYKLDLTAKVK